MRRTAGKLVSSTLRGGARGVIAAMSMSGLRQLTTGLGLVPQTPPEAILQHTAPRVLHRIPVGRRRALVELLHWSYGGVGGALFGTLPRQWRRRAWVGPAYGFLFWVAFEGAIAPLLRDTTWEGIPTKLALLADHTLYGMVVAASPWPHAD